MKKSILLYSILLFSVVALSILYVARQTSDQSKTQYSTEVQSIKDSDNPWRNAEPQIVHDRTYGGKLELVHRIPLEENGIYRPAGLVTDNRRYLAIYDYGIHKIFLIDIENGYTIRTIGDGQGKGPREFVNPTSLGFDINGNIWIADPKQARISQFSINDELISILNMEQVSPFRIAVRQADLIVLATTSTPGGFFHQLNFEGIPIKVFDQLNNKTARTSLLYEGEITEQSEEIYYALRHASIIRKYDANLDLLYSRQTLDVITTPKIESVSLPILGDAVGHRVAQDSEVAALDITASPDKLYILYSGTKYHAYFNIDVYNTTQGDYLYSYQLDHPASELQLMGNTVWVKEFIDQVPYLSGYRF